MRLTHSFYKKGFNLYAKTGCSLPSVMIFSSFLLVFIMQLPKKRAREFVPFHLWKAPMSVGHTIHSALPPPIIVLDSFPQA